MSKPSSGYFSGTRGSRTSPDAGPSPGSNRRATSIPAETIRFSQTSVNGSREIIDSMKRNGWVGDPVDVVRMDDGGLTTLDNTRVVAAQIAGIDVKAVVHTFDEPIADPSTVRRLTTKKGKPRTWGEAAMLRIGKQNSSFRTNHPKGSYKMNRIK